jgi:hypothetical membrane protein
VILGFLTLVLGVALRRWSRDQARGNIPRWLSLSGLTLIVVGLFVFPELFGGGPAPWAFYVVVIAGMIVLAVSWGRSLSLSPPGQQIVSVVAVGLAVLAVVAVVVSWQSLEHFLGTWVTPHNDGWHSYGYAWQAALVPVGVGLVTIGSVTAASTGVMAHDRG